MIVAVHGALGECFFQLQRQRRILEPRNLDRFSEPRVADFVDEGADAVVILARILLQVIQGGELLRGGERERLVPAAGNPEEPALNDRDVMQAAADRQVVARQCSASAQA